MWQCDVALMIPVILHASSEIHLDVLPHKLEKIKKNRSFGLLPSPICLQGLVSDALVASEVEAHQR